MPKLTEKEKARRWHKLAVKRADMLSTMRVELIKVSMLASDKAEFYNPMAIFAARKIRDRVLAEYHQT
jgi:hypothetical protein